MSRFVDDDGEPVADLGPDDLEVYEDGEIQEIRYFSRGLSTDTDTLPMHLGVLLDASASMGGDERLAKTAAIRFLNTLTYAADITLVDFDDTVRVGRYGQRDFPRLVERIRNRKSGGMTAFYDALGVYLDGAFDQDGRKVLLMYSDGYDTRSRMPFSETIDLLRASDVTVYAIGFQSNIPASDRQRERMKLSAVGRDHRRAGVFSDRGRSARGYLRRDFSTSSTHATRSATPPQTPRPMAHGGVSR